MSPLSTLKKNLDRAGYSEAACNELLNVERPSMLERVNRPFYVHRCQSAPPTTQKAAQACLFWLLAQPMARSWLEELAGADGLAWLLAHDIVTAGPPDQGVTRARLDLSPCDGGYFWHAQRLGERPLPDAVPPLSDAIYCLTKLTPRRAGKRALSLYSGAGAGAVTAAASCHSVVAVALNPRAVELGPHNAALNGVAGRCDFVRGELYGPVEGQTFDLIQVAPPHAFRLDSSPAAVPRKLVAGLPEHLSPGGLFAMFVAQEILPDRTYAELLTAWLGGGGEGPSVLGGPPSGGVPGWGISVLRAMRIPVAVHVSCFLPYDGSAERSRAFNECLDSYVRLGCEEVALATVLVERLEPDHPGYAVELEGLPPTIDSSAAVESFLRAMKRSSREPDWERWKPAWSRQRARFWTSYPAPRGALASEPRGRLESTFPRLFPPYEIDAATTQMCLQINGRNSAARLAELWAQKQGVELSVAREAVRASLSELARRLLLKEPP